LYISRVAEICVEFYTLFFLARRERGPPLTDRWRETRRFLEGLDPAGMVNLSRLDCARVLRNDTGYIDDFVRDFGRVTFQDPPVSAADRHLPMDCVAIRQRHLAFDEKFHRERGRAEEKENADYPLAYSRIVNVVISLLKPSHVSGSALCEGLTF
jgi:hypothetical protein